MKRMTRLLGAMAGGLVAITATTMAASAEPIANHATSSSEHNLNGNAPQPRWRPPS